ncbi:MULTISPECIES: hypothetical protein [unclassified Pseudomonas]|uniref:hypothetical protein n=1 Tax=unclassified Pseudomonas TaxID=196821 RepID=UPI000DA75A88|nr:MULTISPECIES: hypothetical protein [unclassified Pseudomonas]MDW3713287.1 hypothetical protein [Pseudomonas sp. 2023EL-01195]PZE12004.1 hypothetical protein DMX10_18140 [Pseudomonas sp. 57B-090624]
MSGKTLTIRDPDVDVLRNIKILTGKGTASQALMAGAALAIRLSDQVADLRDELAKEREKVAVLQRVLADAHGAAVQLAEIAGQGDLFDPSNVLRPSGRRFM